MMSQILEKIRLGFSLDWHHLLAPKHRVIYERLWLILVAFFFLWAFYNLISALLILSHASDLAIPRSANHPSILPKSALNLEKWHFMGQPLVSKSLLNTQALPESLSRFSLEGIFLESGSQKGTALIKLPDGTEKILHQGEEVIPGIFIHEIQSDRVILQREGKYEVLSLPKAELIFESPLSYDQNIFHNQDKKP